MKTMHRRILVSLVVVVELLIVHAMQDDAITNIVPAPEVGSQIVGNFYWGIDWRYTFHNATVLLYKGQSPYSCDGFYNPFWILIPFVPLLFVPVSMACAILYLVNLIAYIYVMRRMRISTLGILFIVLFGGAGMNSIYGNIEGLLSLGLLLPFSSALFLFVLKPQYSIGIVVFNAIEIWKRAGVRGLFRSFAPVSVALVISVAMYGFYFTKFNRVTSMSWNVSVFPYGLIFGVLLMLISIRQRDIGFAMAASPLFAPYTALTTWAIFWIGLFSADWARLFNSMRSSKLNGQGALPKMSLYQDSKNQSLF